MFDLKTLLFVVFSANANILSSTFLPSNIKTSYISVVDTALIWSSGRAQSWATR